MITPERAATNYETTHGQDTPQDWMPVAAGAALVLLALSKKRTLFGLGALLGGGYLLLRAVENGTLKLPKDLDSLGLPADLVDRFRSQFAALGASGQSANDPAWRQNRDWSRPAGTDAVDEASMESFPGSDPPATW